MPDVSSEPWRAAVNNVGLVVSEVEGDINVMAAEWAYFVNKEPLQIAVVLSPVSETRAAFGVGSEFCLTFASADQADLADFVGNFHASDLAKTSSARLELRDSDKVSVPWADGGTAAFECRCDMAVELPVHRLHIADVLQTHISTEPADPLVKHGRLRRLGGRAGGASVVAGAELRGRTLRVAAVSRVMSEPDHWEVGFRTSSGDVDLGVFTSTAYGEMVVDLPAPEGIAPGDRVFVHRDGAEPGEAVVSSRQD
ncbi:flavin reductase family protein [Haloglycomyces albus]|uniref:flavin reductase family protein n=1 Tax=Haloglycomyces albus TaxID=526067 RepID=UPI0004B1F306|nr:flavin reductase [Haloglycomyces albus]